MSDEEFKRIAIDTLPEFIKAFRDLDARYEVGDATVEAVKGVVKLSDDTEASVGRLKAAVMDFQKLSYEWSDLVLAQANMVWQNERMTNSKLPARFVDQQVQMSGQRIEFGYYEKDDYST